MVPLPSPVRFLDTRGGEGFYSGTGPLAPMKRMMGQEGDEKRSKDTRREEKKKRRGEKRKEKKRRELNSGREERIEEAR